MPQETIALKLEKRDVVGKSVKHLRREGHIPAVIHDHGKDSVVVMGPELTMLKVYQEAGKHHPVEITVANKKYMALIRTAAFDPKKHRLQHIVFNAVSADQEVEAEVPVRIEGEIPAERTGLMVITNLDTVEVEALPKDLPDELIVDGASLVEIGDKITVADLQVPTGVKILTEPEHPIATVEETKAQISEEETTEEAEGGESTEAKEASEEE